MKFDMPTLIIHGDDDQILACGATAMLFAKVVKNAVDPAAKADLANASSVRTNTLVMACHDLSTSDFHVCVM